MKLFLVFVLCATYLRLNINAESQNGYKVLCYFQSSSWRRTGAGKFLLENINENLCTHIIYAFANLDNSTLKIIPKDRSTDIDNHYYERITTLRQKGIKVIIAIGGWGDSAGDKYERLLMNETSRTLFVSSAVEFIDVHNFDGMDLDLEYPTCWHGDCKNGNPVEWETFAKLIEELSLEFRPRNWTLSAAVSSSKRVIDRAYDIPKMNQHLDWIGLMTYQYSGPWRKQTAHSAPLYSHPDVSSEMSNVNFTVQYWIEQGASKKKIVLGIPFYGHTFTLADPANFGLNAATKGAGESGTYIRSKGVFHFCDICNKTRNHHWIVVRDPDNRIGPYAYHDNQWVSYDDVDTIRIKAKYIRDIQLAGAMIWSIDLDDFRGDCRCGNYPLLTTLNQGLRNIGGLEVDKCTT